MPQVQMPDGTLVEMPDQLDPALGARLRAFHSAQTAPKDDFMSKAAGRVGDALAAPFEATAGIRDVVTAPFELLGEGMTHLAGKVTSGLAGLAGAEPETMKNIQNAMTYEPRTQTAGAIKEGIGKATQAVSKVTAPVDEAIGNLSPGLRTTIEATEEAIPDVASLLPGGTAARGVARAAAADTAVSGAARATSGDALQTLRAAGYKFRPSDVKAMKPGENVPGLRREGLQEPAALRKDLTLENQANTTRLAAEDLGLKDKTSLMAKDYEDLRKPHFDTYDRVNEAANLAPSTEYAYALKAAQERAGLKGGASATESISALRRNAVKRARSDDIKVNKEGEADLQAANDLEDALEAQLAKQGDAKLMNDYRSARQSLAKIHDYEVATRGGQVDAAKIRQIDKKSPGRLTGNQKIISDAADFAPGVVRHGRGATGVRSSVKADSITGTIKNAAGNLISKLPGMDVSRAGFQNQFGRQATTTAEKETLRDYGKRPEPVERTPAPAVQPGTGSVNFTPTAGVVPSRSLASELELAPEPVQNPVQLPEKPAMLTAETPPPVRGDIDFRASPELGHALAGDLGLAPRPGDGIPYDLEWVPPNMAPQMAGNEALALGLPDDLIAQLGLAVDTPQPSLMTPVAQPVPYGPRVQLEAPPGKIGKPKAKK